MVCFNTDVLSCTCTFILVLPHPLVVFLTVRFVRCAFESLVPLEHSRSHANQLFAIGATAISAMSLKVNDFDVIHLEGTRSSEREERGRISGYARKLPNKTNSLVCGLKSDRLALS